MKRTDPQYKLRIPEDLKAKIEESAKSSNRSMNAEIVARLEGSFEQKLDMYTRDKVEEVAAIAVNYAVDTLHERLVAAGLLPKTDNAHRSLLEEMGTINRKKTKEK